MQQFYMVWCESMSYPKIKHMTEYEAKHEAERLALEEPGLEYYVLKAITLSKTTRPVETIILKGLPY